MKGLLLKDAYQIWHYAKGVIVATVVMMGAGVVTIMNGANFFRQRQMCIRDRAF